MILYTKSGSYPAPLPSRIRLPDGFTRTDPAQFTDEEIALAGYVLAPAMPEFDSETEGLEWNNQQWVVVGLAESEK